MYRSVSVSFFCSGNELVAIDDAVAAGQKISSNRYLLNVSDQAASRPYLLIVELPMIADKDIARLLTEISRSRTDIIISTGGMGPGKYDLLEDIV